jgi:hypothetical protein
MFAAAKASRTSEHSTDYDGLQESPEGLQAEYHRLVTEHVQRWGIVDRCVAVEIRPEGEELGKPVFVAVLRVLAWDRASVLRLLLGLPLLEKKIRKSIEGQWTGEVSVFNGLLLNAGDALQGREAAKDLRHLLVSLTGERVAHRADHDESLPASR